MSNKWAKIFEVEGEQVLFFYEIDNSLETEDDEDRYTIHQIVHISDHGITADVTIKGIKVEDIQDAFDSTNQETADIVYKTIKELIEDQNEPICAE